MEGERGGAGRRRRRRKEGKDGARIFGFRWRNGAGGGDGGKLKKRWRGWGGRKRGLERDEEVRHLNFLDYADGERERRMVNTI